MRLTTMDMAAYFRPLLVDRRISFNAVGEILEPRFLALAKTPIWQIHWGLA